MGKIDRVVRVVIAAVIALVVFTGMIQGTIGIVLIVLASVFLLTSIIGFCPLYAPFGLSSCGVRT